MISIGMWKMEIPFWYKVGDIMMKKEKLKIIEYGLKIFNANLTNGTGGNLSIFNRQEGVFAITPSGIPYTDITEDDIVVLNLDGNQLEGDKKPSSEVDLHRIFYKNRDDINSIIHTHTKHATTLSCLNWDLPAVHYMLALAGPDVRCANYATYGTMELAKNAFEAMKDRKAVILANHGLLAGGKDIENAFSITEEIEYCAELYIKAKSIGEPVILSKDEMNHMMDKFKTYK